MLVYKITIDKERDIVYNKVMALLNTTKINTDNAYKITDALLTKSFTYAFVNNNMCKYIKDNVVFIKEKIPFRHIYVYRFTEEINNIQTNVYTKKSEVRKLIKYIQDTY